MSVLYKALQKAAKENEQQAAVPAEASADDESNAFDPSRMKVSSAISGSRFGNLGDNKRVAGIAAVLVLALVLVVSFFLMDSEEPQVAQTAPAQQAPSQPTPAAPPAAVQQATPAPQTPMDLARSAAPAEAPASQPVDPGLSSGAAPASSETTVAAMEPTSEPTPEPMPEPAATMPDLAPAPAPVSEPAPVAQAAAPPPAAPVRQEPMPTLSPDSPTRALSPPISIRRAEAEFAGAGNLVQVREVSQSAQDNVTAGYNALVRGDIGSAISLYASALEAEPTSIMALLGHSAALQKSGRLQEARTGYERVLRLDSNNREALSNLTTIYSASAPNEALNRLLSLEREYPRFSPVKAQIGLLYARMGSANDALNYLRQAASMAPSTVMYQYNLAVLLDRMGRGDQAVASYERVLAGMINGDVGNGLSRSDIERRVRYLKTL